MKASLPHGEREESGSHYLFDRALMCELLGRSECDWEGCEDGKRILLLLIVVVQISVLILMDLIRYTEEEAPHHRMRRWTLRWILFEPSLGFEMRVVQQCNTAQRPMNIYRNTNLRRLSRNQPTSINSQLWLDSALHQDPDRDRKRSIKLINQAIAESLII
jgi:hypothetical protein